MRKRIILLSLAFFIFQLVSAQMHSGFFNQSGYCAQASAEADEEEEVDPYTWDFGQVKQGAVLKHNFILKNDSNDILGINSIHTSCGCTVSESEKKSLMPQESTPIPVSFNSKGYTGPVTQFVYVNTDSADLGIIKFTIKAEVIK